MANEFPVVFALYPQVTQLDFTGPCEVFWRLPGARCILASIDGGVMETSGGVTFAGLVKLADVTECSLVCVPGGYGTVAAMENGDYLAGIARLGAQAQFITSVCTGSLLLAAAGLLRGRRAACHWAWRDLLPLFGVVPDPARVVRDGNVFTGGGVTAGIDLALTVVAAIAGRECAETIQLAMEYAPAPPFDSGRPEQARPEMVATVTSRLASDAAERFAVAERAARRLAANP